MDMTFEFEKKSTKIIFIINIKKMNPYRVLYAFPSIADSFQFIGGHRKRHQTSFSLFCFLTFTIGVVAFAVYLNNLNGLKYYYFFSSLLHKNNFILNS